MNVQELSKLINTNHGHAVQISPSNDHQLLIYKTDADGVEQLYRISIETVDNLGGHHDNAKAYLMKPYSGNFSFPNR